MLDAATRSLIDRHAQPVPRYTSYPTAPHFHAGIDADTYGRWLGEIEPDADISLYLHIPYCDRLCWFCGCHTKHTLKYEPIARYLTGLFEELTWVSARLKGRGRISAIHLGGGSPTILTPEDMLRLRDHLRTSFHVEKHAEISIEIDPNDLGEEQLDAMMAFGLSRASVGVQDFNPQVQAAINRPQTFEQTCFVIDGLRARGVQSVNIDALYGLPFQTARRLHDTLQKIIQIAPDRVALFGYAHVPWMKRHQRMIQDDSLPDIYERFEHAQIASRMLADAGYQQIGLDHFAKPTDSLAHAASNGSLHRNFQGYSSDRARAVIGLGASAIGKLPQGYVQNIVATQAYLDAVQSGGATTKGLALSPQDKARAFVIEELMCRHGFDFAALARFGGQDDIVRELAGDIASTDRDGLVTMSDQRFELTPKGEPFIRSIAARFDSYLEHGTARHSVAV